MNIQSFSNTFQPVNELRWLFFDLNSYFASVEQQEHPELRGRPVAVVPMMTDSTCAIAASYEAKAYGIKTGTKIYEAKKLCPDLVCVLAKHDLYVQYHNRIMAELEQHTPVTKIWSIDEAACQLFNNDRPPHKAYELAVRIKEGFRRNIGEVVTCSIGIAPNAYLAKVATEMEKPNGLVILEPGKYAERLFALELMDLPGINRGMMRRLDMAGIHSIRQFWHLPPKRARAIWGSVGGEKLWYRLHGYEIPELATKRRMVGHSRVLDPNLRSPEKAYAISRQLTLKAASRLRRYQLCGQCFSLSVRSVHHQRWGAEQSLAPTQDNLAFIRALGNLWQSMLINLQETPLKSVSVAIYDLCEPGQLTLDLFAEPADKTKGDKITIAMDRINQKFGAGTVQVGCNQVTAAGYVGTKIAFCRIPEEEEFRE
jgi:DNA polymerase-4